MSAPAIPAADAALQRRALFAGLAVVILWGASFSIQKAAYGAMQPGPFLFFRASLMGVSVIAVLLWYRRPWLPKLQPGDGRLFATATLTGPFLHVLLVTYGVHWSTPFTSAVIMACGPVITLVLMRVLHGARLRRVQVLGVALAFSGVLLFMADKLRQADLRASGGDLMLLGAAVCFSLYTIRVTPLARRYGGMEIMCWTSLLASPLFMALTFWPALNAPVATFPVAAWGGLVWTVLLTALLAWILWSWTNAVRGVSRTAPLLYLVPPVAGLIGWLFLGEVLTAWKLAGGAIAMTGVALAQWGGPRT